MARNNSASLRELLRDLTPNWLRRRLIPFECELERLAAEFCGRFPGARLLDVAGGAARYAPEAVALDLDLAALRRRKGAAVCADVHRLPVADGRVDAVCCSAALHHFRDPDVALRRIRDCLRPSGLLFLTVPDRFPATSRPDDYWRFGPDELRGLMACSGWLIREFEPIGGRFWTISRHALEALFRPRRGFAPAVALLAAPLLGVAAPLCCYYLDRWDGRKGRPLGWKVVAQKEGFEGPVQPAWPAQGAEQ